ncbi:MAG: hypothetical protein COB04_02175 [Gammaproteobacteria bacterium]|nr:MAG: hypothetical protein COB04_02175 [Gammaproteobacteria bacterium]
MSKQVITYTGRVNSKIPDMTVRQQLINAVFLMMLGGALWGYSANGFAIVSDSAVGKKTIASFMVNFARFIEWPASAFDAPDSPFEICIIGEDPLKGVLDKKVGKKKVKKRSFTIDRLASVDIERIKQCHIVFISQSEFGKVSEIANALTGFPVLTVSDVDGFAKSGGMIGLVGVGRKVKMQINKTRISKANLKASEKLLKIGS